MCTPNEGATKDIMQISTLVDRSRKKLLLIALLPDSETIVVRSARLYFILSLAFENEEILLFTHFICSSFICVVSRFTTLKYAFFFFIIIHSTGAGWNRKKYTFHFECWEWEHMLSSHLTHTRCLFLKRFSPLRNIFYYVSLHLDVLSLSLFLSINIFNVPLHFFLLPYRRLL